MFIVLAVVGVAAYHFAPLRRRDHRVLFALVVTALVFFGLVLFLFPATTIDQSI